MERGRGRWTALHAKTTPSIYHPGLSFLTPGCINYAEMLRVPKARTQAECSSESIVPKRGCFPMCSSFDGLIVSSRPDWSPLTQRRECPLGSGHRRLFRSPTHPCPVPLNQGPLHSSSACRTFYNGWWLGAWDPETPKPPSPKPSLPAHPCEAQ